MMSITVTSLSGSVLLQTSFTDSGLQNVVDWLISAIPDSLEFKISGTSAYGEDKEYEVSGISVSKGGTVVSDDTILLQKTWTYSGTSQLEITGITLQTEDGTSLISTTESGNYAIIEPGDEIQIICRIALVKDDRDL